MVPHTLSASQTAGSPLAGSSTPRLEFREPRPELRSADTRVSGSGLQAPDCVGSNTGLFQTISIDGGVAIALYGPAKWYVPV